MVSCVSRVVLGVRDGRGNGETRRESERTCGVGLARGVITNRFSFYTGHGHAQSQRETLGVLLPFDSQTPRPPRPLRPPRRPQCPDIQAKSSQDVRTLSSMSGHSRGVQGTPQCPDIVFGGPTSGHWNGTSSTSSCPDIVEGVCSMSGHLGQMSVFTSHCICSISASMSGHDEVDEVRSGRSGPFFYCNCRHQRGCRATSALRPR